MLPSAEPNPSARISALTTWRRRIVALTLVVAGASIFGSTMMVEQGCGKTADPPSSTQPILIGVSLGLTKGLSAFAKPLRDSIRVAEGEINASGGLLGRTVMFDVQDDESNEDPTGPVTRIANDFVARGAVAVIGPIGSQQVVATQAIYAKGNVIQISPSATSTDLTTIQSADNRWLFRTTPADDFQGAAVLLFAQKTPRGLGDGGAPMGDSGVPSTCGKLAIVHVDNSYGKSMADVIEKTKKDKGQSLLIRQPVSVTLAASYKDIVTKIIGLNPECLALIAYDDVAAQFVREFKADSRYLTLEKGGFFFIGTDGVYTDGFLVGGRENQSDPTSPNVAEGVYGTNPDTQPGTKEYNEFRTLFSSYFPLGTKDAPAFTANTFDAAAVIALAIQRAGTLTDRNAIRAALLEVSTPPGRPYTPSQLGDALLAVKGGDDIDYKGASGAVDFEANGNVKSGFIVWQAFRDPNTKKVDYRTVGRFTLEELLDQLK